MARDDKMRNSPPTREAVEEALEQALAYEGIASSSQLSRFLEFVVTKKLDGEEEDIKAYSIAVDALGRNESFDPQESAIVRVAAGRLRQVLALHNASLEDKNSVHIILEPGSYVPVFKTAVEVSAQKLVASESDQTTELRPDSQTISTPVIPEEKVSNKSVLRWLVAAIVALGLMLFATLAILFHQTKNENTAVDLTNHSTQLAAQDKGYLPRIVALVTMPDENYPDWFKQGELVDTVGLVMARFTDYQFMGVYRQDDKAAPIVPQTDYRMEISARLRGKAVRFFGTLKRVSDGRVLWSFAQKFDRPEQLEDRNVSDIVGRIYSPLASPYGVLYADLANAGKSRSQLDCIISGYQYFYSENDATHRQARACAEAAVERGTRLPLIYAMLTFLYLDEYRENRNRRQRDPLEAAGKTAEKAVRYGPQSARAHEAVFAFYKVSGEREAARKAGLRSLALNPYDTDILGDYAAWLLSIGNVEEGKSYLQRAEQMFGARPAWFEFYRFLAAQLSKDFDRASEIARVVDFTRSPLLALAAVIGAHHRSDKITTRRALAELYKMEPAFKIDPLSQLLKRGFDKKVAQKLVRNLRDAEL